MLGTWSTISVFRTPAVCPDGYYGDHCMTPCNCSAEGTWQCDPVKGCVCGRGFVGANCDLPASSAVVIDKAGGILNVNPHPHRDGPVN